MKVYLENIPDVIIDSNWHGGGYCDGEVHIDKSLNPRKRRVVCVHEVLEWYLKGRVKHSLFDKIAIEILNSLDELEYTEQND